jgi:ADP-L-glycero-D-manno-heptose 6-epimerase
MILITGAAGFIGSCTTGLFNQAGRQDLVLVDDFSRPDKSPNLAGKSYKELIHRDLAHDWIDKHHAQLEAIIHLGARTDTTETDTRIFDHLNLHYSQRLWQQCCHYELPLVYASSAATYGGGEMGYSDRHEVVGSLRPLNPYGQSKQDFDVWALAQPTAPPAWYGLKFFNVYGPNEYHKGRMASVVFHTFRQIQAQGSMKLFRSHRPGIADGQQSRDFVYVKDVLNVINWLLQARPESGLYNLGTGKARSFLDLATQTFRSMGREPLISFIDTPEDIRETYQYFTQASMEKLLSAGYALPFSSLEEGVDDYVRNYLLPDRYL